MRKEVQTRHLSLDINIIDLTPRSSLFHKIIAKTIAGVEELKISNTVEIAVPIKQSVNLLFFQLESDGYTQKEIFKTFEVLKGLQNAQIDSVKREDYRINHKFRMVKNGELKKIYMSDIIAEDLTQSETGEEYIFKMAIVGDLLDYLTLDRNKYNIVPDEDWVIFQRINSKKRKGKISEPRLHEEFLKKHPVYDFYISAKDTYIADTSNVYATNEITKSSAYSVQNVADTLGVKPKYNFKRTEYQN